MKNDIRITNKCGVSECQLLKALYQTFNSDILKIYAFEDGVTYVTDYDGISVTQWKISNVFDFINSDIYDRYVFCEVENIM